MLTAVPSAPSGPCFLDSDAVIFQDIAVSVVLQSTQLLHLAEQWKKACDCTSTVQTSLKLLG